MEDVIVIGGGVIGLSIAYELAGQGAKVALLDQGDFGREASWAGAGILPPGNRAAAKTPEAQLRALSHALWPDWVESLNAETGIDGGYRRSGGIELRLDGSPDALCDEIAFWSRAEGVAVEPLTPTSVLGREPRLSPSIVAAYRLPDLGQVRNPRHLRALIAGCAARGVRLRPGTPVVGFDVDEFSVNGVRTPTDVLHAGKYCVAGGAWSGGILSGVNVENRVRPIRGQIVLLSHLPNLLSHVVQVGSRYLVPRADGRVLIGSTEEDVGFIKANTPAAVGELIAFAIRVVPALAAGKFEQAWSGLRPYSDRGRPYLGRVGEHENLFVAAGHFRSGLQMSPGTARLLRQVILEQETDLPLEAFACNRLPIGIPTGDFQSQA